MTDYARELFGLLERPQRGRPVALLDGHGGRWITRDRALDFAASVPDGPLSARFFVGVHRPPPAEHVQVVIAHDDAWWPTAVLVRVAGDATDPRPVVPHPVYWCEV